MSFIADENIPIDGKSKGGFDDVVRIAELGVHNSHFMFMLHDSRGKVVLKKNLNSDLACPESSDIL